MGATAIWVTNRHGVAPFSPPLADREKHAFAIGVKPRRPPRRTLRRRLGRSPLAAHRWLRREWGLNPRRRSRLRRTRRRRRRSDCRCRLYCRSRSRRQGAAVPGRSARVEEIVAVMRAAGDGLHARRLRGLIAIQIPSRRMTDRPAAAEVGSGVCACGAALVVGEAEQRRIDRRLRTSPPAITTSRPSIVNVKLMWGDAPGRTPRPLPRHGRRVRRNPIM
jgi:hypothetical protein